MTITKKEIREVKKLQHLDKETMDRLRKQREEIQKDLVHKNATNAIEETKKEKMAEAERKRLEAEEKKEKEKAIKEAQEAANKKKLEILNQFPPEAGWGPEKLKDINGKNTRRQPLTEQEKAFLD